MNVRPVVRAAVGTVAAVVALLGAASPGGGRMPGADRSAVAEQPALGHLVLASIRAAGGNGGTSNSDGGLVVSPGGRYVAFAMSADGIAPGDEPVGAHVYLRDTLTRETVLVSVPTGGEAAAIGTHTVSTVSRGGRFVVFDSNSAELVPGPQQNPPSQVFVRDLDAETTTPVSISSTGLLAGDDSRVGSSQSMSSNGRFVLFESRATNLVPVAEGTRALNIYRHDRVSGRTVLVSVKRSGEPGNA